MCFRLLLVFNSQATVTVISRRLTRTTPTSQNHITSHLSKSLLRERSVMDCATRKSVLWTTFLPNFPSYCTSARKPKVMFSKAYNYLSKRYQLWTHINHTGLKRLKRVRRPTSILHSFALWPSLLPTSKDDSCPRKRPLLGSKGLNLQPRPHAETVATISWPPDPSPRASPSLLFIVLRVRSLIIAT